MKAKRIFALIAAVGVLFGVGCTKEQPLNDITPATISVSPKRHAFTLSGGKVSLNVTSNGSWSVTANAEVSISPASGSGDATVTVDVPASDIPRDILLQFTATKQNYITGIEYTSKPTIVDVVIFQNEAGDATRSTNVKVIRDLLKQSSLSDENSSVSEEIAQMSITGTIVGAYNTSGTFGNMNFDGMYAIQDNSGEAGAGLMFICENTGDKHIPFGQVVTVSLENATARMYSGVLQLDVNKEVVLLDEPTEVEPTAISIANLLDYEGQYVVIEECQPTADVRGKTFNEIYNPKFEIKTGETFVVYANKESAIRNYMIPSKSGSVAGVATRYNDLAEILPNQESDLQLTKELFEIEGVKVEDFSGITKIGTYNIDEVTVVGVSAKSYVIMDSKGSMMLVYQGSDPLEILSIGDKGSISGNVSEYAGVKQFNTPKFTKSTSGTVELTSTQLDDAAFDALYSSINSVQYVQYVGKLTKNTDGYYEVAPATANHKSTLHHPIESIATTIESNLDKYVTISGFALYIEHEMISVIPTDVTTATVSAIAAKDITGVPATGVIDETATFEVENVEGEIIPTWDGAVVTVASVEGTTLTYSVSENTDATPREGWIKLTAGEIETTIKVSQLGVATPPTPDGGAYTQIDSIKDLVAGDYYMAAYKTAYKTTHDFTANPWHLCVDVASGDCKTTPYSYTDGTLTIKTGETKEAVIVTLIAVEGKSNTYYVKINGKYLYSSESATNRKLNLTDTATEWVVSDHASGGIVLNSNNVNLGTANASKDILRTYAKYSSLERGAYFFKKN